MLLAIDTSTAHIGLALYDGAQVVGELLWQSPIHHTQQLAPALAELLWRMDMRMDIITALGVALGPGSFTSLRVGIAFAKGLVLAHHIPVVGIPSLDVVAAAIPLFDPLTGSLQYRKLAAVLAAGRGRLALGWYHANGTGWQTEGPVKVMTAEQLAEKIHKPVIVCGELTAEDRQRLARRFKKVLLASPAQCVRRPGILAELAWIKWQGGHNDLIASLAPIYLHTVGAPPD
jgi:tRNA threonylcarbamoyladenosine biosynthesis protein TsaB